MKKNQPTAPNPLNHWRYCPTVGLNVHSCSNVCTTNWPNAVNWIANIIGTVKRAPSQKKGTAMQCLKHKTPFYKANNYFDIKLTIQHASDRQIHHQIQVCTIPIQHKLRHLKPTQWLQPPINIDWDPRSRNVIKQKLEQQKFLKPNKLIKSIFKQQLNKRWKLTWANNGANWIS